MFACQKKKKSFNVKFNTQPVLLFLALISILKILVYIYIFFSGLVFPRLPNRAHAGSC